ncbi:MAG: FAD-dependent oxidoreductase [Chloroflexota bacterium]
MYEYAVIGKGMIGSAAARYLSQWSDEVVLIGPDEPTGDWSQHDGVFASHYDQGRITRVMDRSIAWGIWAMRSIEAYPEIEAQSGIRFHHACGSVCVGFTEDMPNGYISGYERTAHQLGIFYEKYTSEDFCQRYPEYFFEKGLDVVFEKGQAGYINPRSLVEAQVKITESQGADIVRETVVEIDSGNANVTLTTDGGQTIQAKKVLVAAGAWTEFLTGTKLGLIPTPRTVTMAEIDAQEAERLREMPVIMWYEGMNDPDIEGVYILPPIEYPDGKTYIKLGGALRQQGYPQSDTELRRWFHGEGSPIEARALERELRRVIPGLRTISVQAKTCVVTNRTDENMPLIEPIVEGKVMVAAAGCGSSAKSSNEIGRLAALQLMWMT